MLKLDERISTLESRLKQLKARQQQVETRRRAIQSRQARKADTRRKILLGAIVLERVAQGQLTKDELHAWLDAALTRAEDRALFELPGR
ncbi:MAG: mobilization protein [Steroidobacteraceae bacterium]